MWNQFSDHLGDKKEMVIVNPDCISPFILTYNDFCKGSVDGDVVFPATFLPVFELWIVGDLVMERGPDDLFAVSIVVTFEIGIGYEHRNRSFVRVEMVGDVYLHSCTERIRRLQLDIEIE
jgi:hypothetical protein